MGAPARLIDLSVARTLAQCERLRSAVGTDAYMAPEQCRPRDGAGEAVRWAVVGAFHGQPRVGGVGFRPAGAGGHREARHFVRGLGAGGGGGGCWLS